MRKSRKMACNKVCVAVAIFATCCLWSHLCGPAEAAAVVSATEHSGVKIDDDNFDSKSSNDCAGGGSKNCAKSNSDSDVVVNNSNSNSDSYLGSSVADSFFSSELIEEGLSGFINKNRTARLEEEISQLWSSAVAEFTGDNTIEEGRGKKGGKKKGMGRIFMMMAGLTKAALLYLMIHAVAALAGKALIVAKVALAIAIAVALKKSSDNKTAYEIVKHPQVSHINTHSSSVDYDHHGSASGGNYEGGTRRRRRTRR